MTTSAKRRWLIQCANPRHQAVCMSLLFVIILLNCVVWCILDIFVYGVAFGVAMSPWSMLGLFGSIFIIFAFGFWAYLKRQPQCTLAFDACLLLIIVGFLGYALYLVSTLQWVWALFTLCVAYLLAWMLYGTFTSYRNSKKEMTQSQTES